MFERLDEFIEEESDEILVTGGWGGTIRFRS